MSDEQVVYDENGPVCPCCYKEGEQPHPCPFKQEIYYDDEQCTCCEGCRYQCGMDI